MKFSNFHTHSLYCDGKDTPEDMVLEAIRLGCPALGFSGHAHMSFDDCCMSLEGTREYISTVSELKKRYADKIKIYLGVEQDYYADTPTSGYDYVIGAVHYLYVNGGYYPVDESKQSLLRLAEEGYGGDIYALAEDYYETLGRVYDKTGCDIVAHFDLVTKFNQGNRLFDTSKPRYRRAALTALDRLTATPTAFEINTGAMARGYRTTPYPENFILSELKKRNSKILISSDCHSKERLLYGFEEAEKLINTVM